MRKGEYHYAIRALEKRMNKIARTAPKRKKQLKRMQSIAAALELLRTNNMRAL